MNDFKFFIFLFLTVSMRVIHIIPSAFDYFNDIRAAAFLTIEKLAQFGVDAEAFTLQPTTTVSPKKQETIKEVASSVTFRGMTPLSDMFNELETFDIVHLHVPFLGVGSRIVNWRKEHPRIPFIITYYRSVRRVDLFCVGIALYNRYYLSKLFPRATLVAFQPLSLSSEPPRRVPSVVPITPSAQFMGGDLTEVVSGVEYTGADFIAAKYALIYRDITQTS